MHLPHQFYKFALRFDVARLRAEVEAVPDKFWTRHPQDFTGNSAMPLVSTDGGINDGFEPPMRPTEALERCPYIQQIMSEFHTLLGRARLMRLEPGHGVPAHFDGQYYWRTHTRVHIPIVTDPAILFYCGKQVVHMAAGDAWTFDNWRMHKVVNETSTRRIHLTFDTFGTTAFWALTDPLGSERPARFVPFDEKKKPVLAFESFVGDPVMSPSEFDFEAQRLLADLGANPANNPASLGKLHAVIANLRSEWRFLWFSKGPSKEALPMFVGLARRAFDEVSAIVSEDLTAASNGQPILQPLLATLAAMVSAPLRAETAEH